MLSATALVSSTSGAIALAFHGYQCTMHDLEVATAMVEPNNTVLCALCLPEHTDVTVCGPLVVVGHLFVDGISHCDEPSVGVDHLLVDCISAF